MEPKMNPKIAPMKITEETVRNAKFTECDCGGVMFTEKMMFKKISALLSPTGKDEYFPMEVIVCDKCGKVPTIFNPGNFIPKEYLAEKITKIIQ